jgi:hypothetical protein
MLNDYETLLIQQGFGLLLIACCFEVTMRPFVRDIWYFSARWLTPYTALNTRRDECRRPV